MFGEELVDERDRRAGVTQDVLQLLAGQPKVQGIDHAGTEEAGVEQFEVLMAVARHDREAIVGAQAELMAHAVRQPQHAVAVCLKGGSVRAVVKANPVGPALDCREEVPLVDEFLHDEPPLDDKVISRRLQRLRRAALA